MEFAIVMAHSKLARARARACCSCAEHALVERGWMSPESFERAMEGFLVGVPARKGVRCECFDRVFFIAS